MVHGLRCPAGSFLGAAKSSSDSFALQKIMPSFEQAIKRYQIGKRCGASKSQNLMMVYEEAIAGCIEHNRIRATHALQALSKSLDYNAQTELAVHLNWVYHHCHMLVGRREFEHAARILGEIRDAFKKAANSN